jgi:hypothetical protein
VRWFWCPGMVVLTSVWQPWLLCWEIRVAGPLGSHVLS